MYTFKFKFSVPQFLPVPNFSYDYLLLVLGVRLYGIIRCFRLISDSWQRKSHNTPKLREAPRVPRTVGCVYLERALRRDTLNLILPPKMVTVTACVEALVAAKASAGPGLPGCKLCSLMRLCCRTDLCLYVY